MQINSNNLEVVDITTICDVLNCSKNTAYALLSETPKDNKITAWRVGNRWKCSKAALDDYILRQSHLIQQ